jgi:flagellar hook-associated protein 3 FlgL
MISTLNAANQQFVLGMNSIMQRLSTDQLNISSGVTLRNVSDNPDQVSSLLQARAQLAGSQQVSANLINVTSEVNAGEQALESTVQIFDQVQTLGAQGATGTQNASGRAALAQQLQGIEQQMVNLANSNEGGRFLFSGDSDQTAAYAYDPSQPNPVSSYQGSASTRVALHPNGTTFPTALTAQTIFDSTDPSNNVFAAIKSLITALNNNDPAAIQASVNGLSKVGSYLNQQLAVYGNTQDTVIAATDFASTQQVQIQSRISGMQDTDMTAAILDLTQTQTQAQAALGAEAKAPRTSLFDYLA